MKKHQRILSYLIVAVMAIPAALNYQIFVFPNSFAPSGVDGICTIIQYLTNTNMGYLSLLFNIPILTCGVLFFSLKRDYIIKNILYVAVFSLSMILFGMIDLSGFLYHTSSGTSTVLAPIAGGVVRGLLYAATLKAGGAAGGVDVIAAMVQTKRPHYNIMNIIFALNASVAILSYFVYGFQLEPVICSIIYAFVTSAVSKYAQSLGQERVRFEVITSEAEALCTALTHALGVGATVIDARGAYSGKNKKMVICVTKSKNAPKIEELLGAYEDAVVFESRIHASMHLQ